MEYQVKGLTEEQVQQSRGQHGSNAITQQEVESFWDKLKENFKDPMIVILLVALVVITLLALTGFAEWYEGVGIAAAVALATLVSTASEYKNEQTFQKLQEEASRIDANVYRDGHVRSIPIDDIVVGDAILLQPGDKISADGVMVQGTLKVNQAMFTGEPKAVPKQTGEPGTDEQDLDDPHRLFRGTTVEDGEGVMEVTRVGDHTHFGKLAQELQTEDRKGPLRIKLANLADGISRFGYIGSSLIALAFIFKVVFLDNNFDKAQILAYLANWQMALYDVTTAAILAVIIIVVAVPEGLPMMIAIVLSQNMRKLLNSQVLVRQLLGIETAGSLNILFCDKTGTITKGQLEAVGFMTESDGEAEELREYIGFDDMPADLRQLLDMALRENTSCVIDPTAEKESDRLIGGNVTERALLQFVGADRQQPLYDSQGVKLIEQILFNARRKFSATRVDAAQCGETTFVKGAPERLIAQCSHCYDENMRVRELSETRKEQFEAEMNRKSDDGFRIIAVATGNVQIDSDADELPSGFTLIGFVSIRDDLREEAKPALDRLAGAGIQVVMLTGDKFGTAKAIAKEVGMLGSEKQVVMESSRLESLTDDQLKAILPDLKVIARCVPSDKKRLVKVAQEMGYVVGMTGDGVNDAPALSNADIGFGMGSGSEVAKEASEIVILDDNIDSIANAVHYGRTIYRSIQKFITFQLTVNVSAILVAFLGPFMGYKLPLTMIQLLWINLIMDTLAALAFSGEPPLEKHMRERPKTREESIIDRAMWSSILCNGIFIALLAICFFKVPDIETLFHSHAAYLTGFFGFFVFINNFNKFNVRVDDVALFDHILQNRGFLRIVGLIFLIQVLITYFGGEMFRTVALRPVEWVYIVIFSLTIVLFDLVRKSLTILLLEED